MSDAIVIAHVSDVHAGSSLALCPPEIDLDDGGKYVASKAQSWLWQCWSEYWSIVERTRNLEQAKLYQIFNGDAVEGDHHRSTQILSANPTAQAAVWDACISVPLALKPDAMFVIRGTETHVGQSASSEERIARGLLKDGRPIQGDPDSGTASWWHLRAEIQGIRLDVAHHGRTGQREHTRGSQAVLHAHDILLAHVKNNDLAPHLCLRGHHHKWNDSGDACPVRVVTSGAWQLATSHVHKVATDSMADIGGHIIVIRDGSYTVSKVAFKAERGSVWRAA